MQMCIRIFRFAIPDLTRILVTVFLFAGVSPRYPEVASAKIPLASALTLQSIRLQGLHMGTALLEMGYSCNSSFKRDLGANCRWLAFPIGT